MSVCVVPWRCQMANVERKVVEGIRVGGALRTVVLGTRLKVKHTICQPDGVPVATLMNAFQTSALSEE